MFRLNFSFITSIHGPIRKPNFIILSQFTLEIKLLPVFEESRRHVEILFPVTILRLVLITASHYVLVCIFYTGRG